MRVPVTFESAYKEKEVSFWSCLSETQSFLILWLWLLSVSTTLKNGSSRQDLFTRRPPPLSHFREERSMDQCRSRPELSEGFERHWSIPISYGPIIGPYLFLGKFVWTNGPESSSKVSPYTGIGPWMAFPNTSTFMSGAVHPIAISIKSRHELFSALASSCCKPPRPRLYLHAHRLGNVLPFLGFGGTVTSIYVPHVLESCSCEIRL